MYPALEAAWAKYNRAARDLRTLHLNRDVFLDREPYRIDVELDDRTNWWIAQIRIIEEPPPVFGVLVGSMAHQLYSALNHVTFSLAVQNLGEERAQSKRRELDFPIASSPEAFNKCKTLKHVSQDTAATFERLQPYHRSPGPHGLIEHPLLLVKELADADKHRVLVASYGTIDLRSVLSADALGWNRAVASDGEFEPMVDESDRIRGLADGAQLARVRFRVGNADASPRIEPQPQLEIVFESDTWAGLTLTRLGDCVATVSYCISQLAQLFPGEQWPPSNHDAQSPYDW